MPECAAGPHSRFANWPLGPARVLLALLLAALVLAAWVPIRAGEGEHAATQSTPAQEVRTRDEDLALYDDVIARLRHGEAYYAVIAQEHRRHRFPLHPGFAVRLPTLAVIEAALPDAALVPLSLALAGAVMLAWYRKLADSPQRLVALAMLGCGISIGLTRYFFVLHELWAGQLLALAMGLHRPERGRWIGAWLAAAMALSIREHALPFALLMAAFALWHRRWAEAAAWSGLVLGFGALLALHLHTVAGLVASGDAASAPWITLRGLTGWLSMVVLSGNLRWLPHALAGPIVIASVFGWASWRGAAGAFGTLLHLGYGLLFMIAGRGDNFYWGMMVAPTLLVGLAFLPPGLSGVWRAAGLRTMPIVLPLPGVRKGVT